MLELAERKINYLKLARTISVVVIFYFCPAPLFGLTLKLFGWYQLNAWVTYVTVCLRWVGLFSIWVYSVKAEKRPLLIWQEQQYSFLKFTKFIFLLFVVNYLGVILVQVLLYATHLYTRSSRLVIMITLFKQNKGLLVFSSLTAGIAEELVFRGYLQSRLEIIFGKPWPPIIISSVLFGLLHYGYGTLTNMASPFVIGLIFSWFYSNYKNIKILMVTHFLWDLVALLILINRH